MAKHYVLPLAGTTVLLSLKAALNPHDGSVAYAASLPNLIGGNDWDRVARTTASPDATVQKEAREETMGRLTLNAPLPPAFFVTPDHYHFYVTTTYTLGARQNPRRPGYGGVRYSDAEIDAAFAEITAGNAAPCPSRRWRGHTCDRCDFYHAYPGYLMDYLETTGDVLSLDLLLVDSTTPALCQASITANATGWPAGGAPVAAPAAIAQFEGSHSIVALQILAVSAQRNRAVTGAAQELDRAELAVGQLHITRAPTTAPDTQTLLTLSTQRTAARNLARIAPAVIPAAGETLANIRLDLAALQACHPLLLNLIAGVPLPAPPAPAPRAGAPVFVTALYDYLRHAHSAQALLVAPAPVVPGLPAAPRPRSGSFTGQSAIVAPAVAPGAGARPRTRTF